MYQLPIVTQSSKPIKTDLAKVKSNLSIVFKSFGVKTNQPFPHADMYIDCRGIPDPSPVGGGNGDVPSVQDWVRERIDLTLYYQLVMDHFGMLTARKGAGNEYEKPFTILTMCAHGIHRSRAMKHLLATALRGNGYLKVKVE